MSNIDWSTFKLFVFNQGADVFYVEGPRYYKIYATRGDVQEWMIIGKTTPINTMQADFETNYKPTSNVITNKTVDIGTMPPVTVNVSTSAPTFSNKLKNIFSDTSITLNKNSAGDTTLSSYLGSGVLSNLVVQFDTDNVYVTIEVDGEKVVDQIDLDALADMGNKDGHYSPLDVIGINYDKESFMFSPKYPISYSTSVVIKARHTGSETYHEMINSLVVLTKET